MSKGAYQAVNIKDVDQQGLATQFDGESLCMGIDVGKEDGYACLMTDEDVDNYYVIYFDTHDQLEKLLECVDELPCDELVAVVEPTGTYHEPIQAAFEQAGYPVDKMKPHVCQAFQDVFDDVPSLHDGKAAYLISRLHAIGLSDAWHEETARQRAIKSGLRRLEYLSDSINQLTGHLEARLAAFWPALTGELGMDTATLPQLLAEYPTPEDVTDDPEGVRKLIRSASHSQISHERIDTIIEMATDALAQEAEKPEKAEISDWASRLRQARQDKQDVIDELEQHLFDDEQAPEETEAGRIRQFGGVQLAATLVGLIGSARDYESAKAYEKAAGLNLRETSSGKRTRHETNGSIHITKRGPGKVRHHLYFLAKRKVQSGQKGCPYVRAWYQKRREDGHADRALVAVMRKLLRAIYHMAHGEAYDPTKLFDVTRLSVAAG